MLAEVAVVVMLLMAGKVAQVVEVRVLFILQVVLMQLREQLTLAEAEAVLLMAGLVAVLEVLALLLFVGLLRNHRQLLQLEAL